jgi:DNA polymerase elongation subunit (family B)
MSKPKILVFDIETSPITAYTWGLHDQNIALNQIKKDWQIIAWAAKWYGDPESKVIYRDNRRAKDLADDKSLVRGLAALLNKADIVITQNGEQFDIKKLNARAAINGLPPIKPVVGDDLLKQSRKVFRFTSHKLEYMAEQLNTKYKKLKHDKFPGFELWSAILAGDRRAWDEMKTYCIHDVLATEELHKKLSGWIKTQNLGCYTEDGLMRCKCGSTRLRRKGYARTEAGKYQIYLCLDCGKWPRGPKNLFKRGKRQRLLRDWR